MFVILAGYHPFDMYGDAPEAELMKRIEAVKYDFDDDVWDEISCHGIENLPCILQFFWLFVQKYQKHKDLY